RSVYGNYDPGTFLSFVTALLLALDPARRLSQLRISLKTSLVGVGMVHGLLEDNEPDDSGSKHDDNALDISAEGGVPILMQNVSFGYGPNSLVLKNFTMSIQPGEMIALVGPSGAGKSTVLSLLLRFHRHQSGSILIGGKDIDAFSVPA